MEGVDYVFLFQNLLQEGVLKCFLPVLFLFKRSLLLSLKDGLFADCGLFPLPVSLCVSFYDRHEQTLYISEGHGKSKEKVYENLRLKSI